MSLHAPGELRASFGVPGAVPVSMRDETMPRPTKPTGKAAPDSSVLNPIGGADTNSANGIGIGINAAHCTGANNNTDRAEAAAKLLHRVGTQVRQIRKSQSLSRRALSERSGVSQRYLAQLECGEGNISLTLLLKVAQALNVTIDQLLHERISHPDTVPTNGAGLPRDLLPDQQTGGNDPDNQPPSIDALYHNATVRQRQSVLDILAPQHESANLSARRIALIGLRGAGKSTLGRQAAAELKLPFVELNHEIEQASGLSLAEVFGLYGPEGYRLLERQSLETNTASLDTVVLAVAGGIVANPSSFEFLLRHYFTVWLKATPEDHMARVKQQGDERPMAGTPHAMAQLRILLASREVFYARADAVIDTSNATEKEVRHRLVDLIGGHANGTC